MLRFRLLVHDSDILQRRIAARQSPLVAEHVEESLFEIRFGYRRTRQPGFALTVDQQRIEKTAARIGVDLDEMRALLVQVEIVAEEDAKTIFWRRTGNVSPLSRWRERVRERGVALPSRQF